MIANDPATEAARLLYLVVDRNFKRWKCDTFRVNDLALIEQAGIERRYLLAAQTLLVSAGLIVVNPLTTKTRYSRPRAAKVQHDRNET